MKDDPLDGISLNGVAGENTWKFETAAEMRSRPMPRVEWDVTNLVERYTGPVLMYGKPGAYKTWLAMHSCMCAVLGQAFLGKYFVRRRTNAVIVNLDAGKHSMPQRIHAFPHGPGNLHITSPDAYDREELEIMFARWPGSWVVVDCFADIFAPEKNTEAGQAMRATVRDLRALYEKYECNGFVIDQSNRQDTFYGNSQKLATIRQMWRVEEVQAATDESAAVVRIFSEKLSEAQRFAPVTASVAFVDGRVSFHYESQAGMRESDQGDKVLAVLMQQGAAGCSRPFLESMTGLGKNVVLDALKRLQAPTSGGARATLYYAPGTALELPLESSREIVTDTTKTVTNESSLFQNPICTPENDDFFTHKSPEVVTIDSSRESSPIVTHNAPLSEIERVANEYFGVNE